VSVALGALLADTHAMGCRFEGSRVSFFALLVFSGSALSLSGCGLVLDYDPPEDGGADVSGFDAPINGSDGGTPPCRTDLECDDGDLCDGQERCVDGACAPGRAVVCEDDDVCDGRDACEPSTGMCVPEPAPPCTDDGNPCNGEEFCDATAGCSRTPALMCDDGIDCTVDRCEPGTGCVYEPSDALCTFEAGGRCEGGGCRYPTCVVGTASCASSDPCFVPRCEGSLCVREPIVCPAGQECCGGECGPADCEDDNPCTDDVCRTASGCVHVPHVLGCDDGDRCTLGDRCEAGTCVAGARRMCGVGLDDCTGGLCNVDTGMCEVVLLEGTACVDADACTIGDVCAGGVCTPGVEVDCEDGEFCTTHTCDPALGCRSMNLPNGTSCPGIGPSICLSGRCTLASVMCPVGQADCDGTPGCECEGICRADGSCLRADRDCRVLGCMGGQECCDGTRSGNLGNCYDTACLGCCGPG
jgi:hypothetical protein